MDAATHEALLKSIAHWEDNVRAEKPEDVKLGHENCALCDWHRDTVCVGCPVYQKSGERYCRHTPYGSAYSAWNRWSEGDEAKQAFKTAAQAELDFLKSLLPEGENE